MGLQSSLALRDGQFEPAGGFDSYLGPKLVALQRNHPLRWLASHRGWGAEERCQQKDRENQLFHEVAE
jgi:hypothetical protein